MRTIEAELVVDGVEYVTRTRVTALCALIEELRETLDGQSPADDKGEYEYEGPTDMDSVCPQCGNLRLLT